MKSCRSLAVALIPLTAAIARAGDPIAVTETTTSSTPVTVQFGGHNLERVTDELLLGRGPGGALYGQNVSASINYAGVPNAVRITVSADHTTATLAYPGTGRAVKTFTANSNYFSPASSLDHQIYDTISSSHNRDWEDLQSTLNHQSLIMPADGNPSAATGFLAQASFDRFALVRDQVPASEARRDKYDYYAPVLSLNFDGSYLNTGGFTGWDYRWELAATGRFNSNLGYSLVVPYQYRQIDGAGSETVAIEAGLPIDILTAGSRQPFSWTLTPFVEMAVNDSHDLGSTVGIFDGGLASRIAVRLGPRHDWVVAFGSQFTGFNGFRLGRDGDLYDDNGNDDGYYNNYYGGYDYGNFRGHVSQQLYKNGIQVVHDFHHGVSLDLGVTYSSFLQNAAVDQWWTPRLGVGWQINRYCGLRWDINGDLANHYTAVGGKVEVDFRF